MSSTSPQGAAEGAGSFTAALAVGPEQQQQQSQQQPGGPVLLRSVEEGLRLMSVDDGRRRNAKRFRPWVVGMVAEEMAVAAADLQQHWSQFGFMDEGNPREVVARLTDIIVGRVRFLSANRQAQQQRRG